MHANHSRPYQGYPYVKPIATEAPSLSQEQVAEMARWADLPRTATWGAGRRDVGNGARPATSKSNPESTREINEKEEEHPPVVYIDMPTSKSNPESTKGIDETEDEVPPVVYIDMPEANSSDVSQRKETSYSQSSTNKDEGPPMVYIDMPEEGSDVSQNRYREQLDQPSFVQETIFYDPFKDRRIDVTSEGSSGESSRPAPPSGLNVASVGSSGYNSLETRPPLLSKESQVYKLPTPDDGFQLSPLDVGDFPPPPPPYQEIDPQHQQPEQTQPEGSGEIPPPRTQVIVSGYPVSPDPNRKYVSCQYCHQQGHALVIRETGIFTHAVACVVLFGCFPLVPLVYCTSVCKHRNHYCPHCNRRVAYEIPIICIDLTYTRNS